MFKKTFLKNNGVIIEKGNKFSKSTKLKTNDLLYVESATNRISLTDFFCLLFLKMHSKNVIVFIRDIYIELFPEKYNSLRSRVTLILNKLSNFYLTCISNSMAFPTEEMGEIFFRKNSVFPKRNYFALPPGTSSERRIRRTPDFDKKLGLLYLGSTKYTNSGFDKFIRISEIFSENYNFFVLSGDKGLVETLKGKPIILNKVEHDQIIKYIENNNIAYAIHTRPKNTYDDLTFPIKVLDFINMQLPFFTEKHLPLIDLLGDDYKFFCKLRELDNIHEIIQNISETEYKKAMILLYKVKLENTYDDRFKKLCSQ
jgi:hypothetical protein